MDTKKNAIRDFHGQDTGKPNLTSDNTRADLKGHQFETQGWIKLVDKGVDSHKTPELSLLNIQHHYPESTTNKIWYQGKVVANNRIWAVLRDGSYLPLGPLSSLNVFRNQVTVSPKYDYFESFSYVQDQNKAQPVEAIWPYTATSHSGKNDVNGDDSSAPVEAVPSQTLVTPTAAELARMQAIDNEISQTADAGTVTIAFIADTHIDSWKTPGTMRALREIQLMSYYAKNFGVDLMIHGGDVNDGIQPKEYSESDVTRAMDAMKMGQRPFIVLQGNHDDNSGYSRDVAGYDPDQVITNADSQNLRVAAFDKWLDIPTGDQNPNQAVFGRYDVPNSSVVVLVLDGFDMPDLPREAEHYNTFRHGYTHYSESQINWLQQTLAEIDDDKTIVIFDHITVNGIDPTLWQAGGRFENNTGKAAGTSTRESHAIYQAIVDHQAQHHNVAGFLAGHTHMDDAAFSGDVQFATVTCGLSDRGDGKTQRQIGKLNESAFEIIQINPVTRSVTQHRLGFQGPNFKKQWQF
ncbi:metallophosphoesterase [Lentilactobacillus senioris]|uniref:metallophosphoesterase family protein n=1 Tax=Lentilactobacillus senioris TaxID=931534 RepID=UPI00227EB272|nr:metallophosphoesterase [Lentilactobacillus senioris]MCY9806226.1 metallophosphoesterase [Lentilactobacillus senioris]